MLSGAARTMDVGATFNSYVQSATPEQADLEALAADFLATAEDFRAATAKVATPQLVAR
jgi:hypothetical protein